MVPRRGGGSVEVLVHSASEYWNTCVNYMIESAFCYTSWRRYDNIFLVLCIMKNSHTCARWGEGCRMRVSCHTGVALPRRGLPCTPPSPAFL